MIKPFLPRTDLALESADTGDGLLPEGVFVQERQQRGVRRTTVRIQTEQAARRLGRPIGRYETLEGALCDPEPLVEQLCDCLLAFLPAPEHPVLVVGLGNRDITPDLLGPEVAQRILATEHLTAEALEQVGLPALRRVCAVAPGVMGQTGLEVAQLVAALLPLRPFGAVVAVDAFAARSAGRLGNTIQLSDSGISPGSGVHNSRAALSQATLGVPVLSLGIPTVVDAATLLADHLPDGCLPCENSLSSLMVTPRGIDGIILQGAGILARALNRALQPMLDPETVDALMS